MGLVKKVPILLLISGVLLVLWAMAQAATSVSDTAQQFAPIPQATADIALDRRAQEAQVTATYIAVLKSEVVSDTKMTHALQRQREQGDHERAERVAETMTTASQVLAWSVAIGSGVVVIALAVKFGAAWVASGIKSARESVMPLPQLSRALTDGVHLLADGRATDTRSLASWSVVSDVQPTMEQAQAIAEIQSAVYREIARLIVPMLTSGKMMREVVER